MWVDSRLEFSDAQAVTVDVASTNLIDLTGVALQVGVGQPLWVVMTLDVVASDGDADETYSVELETDAAAAFASRALLASQEIVRGSVAGSKFALAVPVADMERFLRLTYNVGGTTPTMTISAFLTDQEPAIWQSYADASN